MAIALWFNLVKKEYQLYANFLLLESETWQM